MQAFTLKTEVSSNYANNILATSKVVSGRVPTCHSVHLWRLYSAARLGNQVASTMTQFPTQSHYPDTEPTSPCPILIMSSTRLGSDKYQFKSLVWLDQVSNPQASDSNPWSLDSPISQNRRRALYSLGHPDWSTEALASIWAIPHLLFSSFKLCSLFIDQLDTIVCWCRPFQFEML